MERRACTARIAKGRTRTRPCRNVAPCTRVRILNADGDVLEERWVCTTCRERMRLPEHDVDFQPGVTEVSDQVVYEPGAPVPDGQDFTIATDGPEKLRLP